MEVTELQEVSQVNDEDLANVLAHLTEDADSTQGENVAALDIEKLRKFAVSKYTKYAFSSVKTYCFPPQKPTEKMMRKELVLRGC